MTRKSPLYPYLIVTLLALVSVYWARASYESTIEILQAVTRFTARISLLMFAMVFTASALHKLLRKSWTAEFLKNWRPYALSFAYAHTIHLFAIFLLYRQTSEKAPLVTMVFGGLAYLLIYVMAFTTNEKAVKKMGFRNWKALHRVALFYIWFIFFMTYIRRLMPADPEEPGSGGSKTEFIIAFILVIAMMLVRIAAAVFTRAGRKSKIPAEREAIS